MRIFFRAGYFAAALILALGVLWTFDRGAHDFSVFYTAWKMVLAGQGPQIYDFARMPDRFLYSPGFAWALSPLGLLPRESALAIWTFGKVIALLLVVRGFADRLSLPRGLCAWSIVLLARPLLIDFQYGQVNTYLMAIAAWVFLSPGFCSYFLLAFGGVAKLFLLPLLLLPWLKRNDRGRLGSVLGVFFVMLIPLVSASLPELDGLYLSWKHALILRGLPLESHNQSFIAFLHHYFTARPFHVIAMGTTPLSVGWDLLGDRAIRDLSLAWSLGWAGVILGLIANRWRPLRLIPSASPEMPARTPRLEEELRWAALVLSLLILPSHLLWKPYLVYGIPLGILALRDFRQNWKRLLALGIVLNFSTLDFIGEYMSARLEAASLLLWLYLVLIALVVLGHKKSQALSDPASSSS